MRIVDGYANGVDGSTAGGPGGHDEVDLSMQLPSRSYLDRGNNDGYRTPVRMDSLSPGHSPVLSKAPLTEPSTEEYQSEQAEVSNLCTRGWSSLWTSTAGLPLMTMAEQVLA